MNPPSRADVERLIEWAPGAGVISAYVAVDPGDRGQGWRIDLRNRLHALSGGENGVAAASARILERLSGDETPEGRTQIAFVEASAERGIREEWFSLQVPLPRTIVHHGAVPLLTPLVGLLGEGAARAIALVSAERVRLLRWEFGRIEELESWGLEIVSLDWRERKAQRPADPGRAQGVSTSGRDRFEDRLDANRERFLHETGRLAAERARELELGALVAVGRPEHSRAFVDGAGEGIELEAGDPHDLISTPAGDLEQRIGELVTDLNRRHDEELVGRTLDAARSGGRGSLGRQATEKALEEGSVEHLLISREKGYGTNGDGPATDGIERLVRSALATAASVTVVGDGVGEEIQREDGIGALLRYRPTTAS